MNDLIHEIAKLRTCVAFLGEKEQGNWWSSSFLSSSGSAFLTPVFPKTSLLARVNGASTAAQVVHDEHIGVGNVYHLFRLPENIEREIAQILTKDQSFSDCITSVDSVYSNLQSMSEGDNIWKQMKTFSKEKGLTLSFNVVNELAKKFIINTVINS